MASIWWYICLQSTHSYYIPDNIEELVVEDRSRRASWQVVCVPQVSQPVITAWCLLQYSLSVCCLVLAVRDNLAIDMACVCRNVTLIPTLVKATILIRIKPTTQMYSIHWPAHSASCHLHMVSCDLGKKRACSTKKRQTYSTALRVYSTAKALKFCTSLPLDSKVLPDKTVAQWKPLGEIHVVAYNVRINWNL